jgi:hypothetical protein
LEGRDLAAKSLLFGAWISLDFLGFPWILSCEARLINGLHGIFAGNIFAPLSPLRDPKAASRQAGEEQDRSWVNLTIISAFPQDLGRFTVPGIVAAARRAEGVIRLNILIRYLYLLTG